MKDFEGRVVLVTGARGNLGSAVTAELQDRGAIVVCVDAAPLSMGAAQGGLQSAGSITGAAIPVMRGDTTRTSR